MCAEELESKRKGREANEECLVFIHLVAKTGAGVARSAFPLWHRWLLEFTQM